ncbi:MAG: Gfo/Idh/MocA family oxidoreductase [Planctomycetes bacterium]|nr:Gfo/Idh/MocA family oxidoreductase [Planctomycetota bacterium]
MESRISRRGFLRTTAGAGFAAGLAAPAAGSVLGANERILAGVMGINGRGSFLSNQFANHRGAEVACLADVNRQVLDSRAKDAESRQGKRPKTFQDFRKILDDPDVDVLVNATPDHWHALGTVLACRAGKDVYVEKPACHSVWEGRKMVEAARKYDRIVQLGTQTRSGHYAKEAVALIRSGGLGDIHLVKIFNMKTRGELAPRPDEPAPEWLDWNMWLGPAPMRPFNRNHFQGGCWNWKWDYSGGDIINDGVHQMDAGRWMMDRPYPKSVCAAGGIFALKDGQDSPDTQIVIFEYDGLTLLVSNTLWTPYMKKIPLTIRDGDLFPPWPTCATKIEVYGTKGLMLFGRHGGGWEVVRPDGSTGLAMYGRDPFPEHLENFLDCVKTRKRPNADIEEGHRSTLLCHLANISYRVGGRRLVFDGATESFPGDEEANRLLKRTYREPWVIPDPV